MQDIWQTVKLSFAIHGPILIFGFRGVVILCSESPALSFFVYSPFHEPSNPFFLVVHTNTFRLPSLVWDWDAGAGRENDEDEDYGDDDEG